MYGLNDERYQVEAELLPAQEGVLLRGKDLALKRNVLLYQFTKLSDEEALQLIRNVDGFNHPRFFHILDVSHSARGLLVALELREGTIASQAQKIAPFSFEQCLEMTLEIGKLVEIALSQGIRDFSLSTENLWLTDDGQLMIINFWGKEAKQHRGAIGLFHLLYQLLSRSTNLPAPTGQWVDHLQQIQQAHSLSEFDYDILVQLYREAFIQSSPSFSFTLLLSQLIHSRKETLNPTFTPPTAAEASHPASLDVKGWLNAAWTKLDALRTKWLRKEKLQKLRSPIDRIRKVQIPKDLLQKSREGRRSKKPYVIIATAVVAALIILPLIKLGSKGEQPASIEVAEENNVNPDQQTTTEEDAGGVEDHDTPPVRDDTPTQNDEEGFMDEVDESDEELLDEEFEEQADGTVYVPNLRGLSQHEAEQAAKSAGLYYSFRIVANEEEPAGLVFEQDLEPGATVAPQTRVTFWISRGP
ncbi:hypothetical protein BEP19_08400 [Ammoniphilus oxalaticus]|uniref:PASTA domain-containing protein n=1 Tax=Ammoniphilus oxalaticus TaxID=66863 RepID=A0A419SK33_9BACL|nr:PASTA domain-containing protein [Ammoniphilus oxalaticus]RKD24401.1 hypothetical protein BEP19_08400 [Ammoniphilus oxalaticus]